MRGWSLLSILLVLLLTSWPSPARSTPIRWRFAGTADFNTINEATTFSGAFTFDASTPDRLPDLPSLGSYLDVMLEFSVTVGDFTASLEDFEANFIRIENGETRDLFRAGLPRFVPLGGLPLGFTTFFLQIFLPTTAFPSDALPELPPTLPSSSLVIFEIGTGDVNSERRMAGSLTELAVPEPSSGSLVVLASATITLFRGSRRHWS